jgi:hypothetical protein
MRRFRSKTRDIETDIARVMPIFDAIRAAARDAEKELQGIQARLNMKPGLALVGGPDDMAGDEADDPATRAERRSRYLRRELAALQRIQTLLSGIVRPQTEFET